MQGAKHPPDMRQAPFVTIYPDAGLRKFDPTTMDAQYAPKAASGANAIATYEP